MKRLLLFPILILFLASCDKENDEFVFEYSYKITRSMSLNDTYIDSIIYFYNDDDRLLRVDEFPTPGVCSEFYVKYGTDSIYNWTGTYYFDEADRVNACIRQIDRVDFYYEDDLIAFQKQSTNGFVSEEKFFFYDNTELVKDSTVIHHQEDPNNYITVYQHTYTDTLNPGFLVDYSGLFEIALKSKYLIKESESPEHGILLIYSYEISENRLVQKQQFWDTFHNEPGEIFTSTYVYEVN